MVLARQGRQGGQGGQGGQGRGILATCYSLLATRYLLLATYPHAHCPLPYPLFSLTRFCLGVILASLLMDFWRYANAIAWSGFAPDIIIDTAFGVIS
jgi:hypothetical protein